MNVKELINQINHTRDRLFSYDENLVCLVINDRMQEDYEQAFGRKLNPGDGILEAVPEPLYSQWKERYELALQGKELKFQDSFDIEGVPSHVLVTLVPIKEGDQTTAVACTVHDVSEQNSSKMNLQRNEALLIAQIENTTDAIWSVDRNYRILILNTSMIETYIQSFDHILKVGDNILEFTPVPIRQVWKDYYDRCLAGEQFKEVYSHDMGNETMYVEVSFNPIWIEDQVVGVACFTKDITESKSSEMALKEALETKDKLFSIIAHDLKGPISNIRELTKIILSPKGLDEVQRVWILEQLDTMSKNVYELLDNLLAWAMFKRELVKSDRSKMNVRQIVHDSIKMYQANAESKSIHTSINIDQDEDIFADQRSITSIIGNLYNNAVKFTHEKGSITINAKKIESNIQFDIIDDGVGMSKDTLENLFNEAKVSTQLGTLKERGTGLGLLLCKEFVELNGGEIWVDSELGNGTAFYFTIPLA